MEQKYSSGFVPFSILLWRLDTQPVECWKVVETRMWDLVEGRYITEDMPLDTSAFQALSFYLFLSCHVSNNFVLLFVPCNNGVYDYRPKINE